MMEQHNVCFASISTLEYKFYIISLAYVERKIYVFKSDPIEYSYGTIEFFYNKNMLIYK